MFLEPLLKGSPELLWAIAVFAVALPIEHFFGSGYGTRWSERLGNLGAMLVHFFVGGAIVLMLFASPLGMSIQAFPREPRWEIVQHPLLWAFAVVLVTDGLYYVYHRLQHAVPLLWHIHKLHHTDPAMNITTSKRTHFLERPLQALFVNVPGLWLLGLHAEGLVYAALAGAFFLYFAHLDVRLRLGPLTAIIVGPHYHRVHHSESDEQQNTNFAQAFPLFDILGGTYHRPKISEFPATGVKDCKTAAARWRPLIW